MNAFQTTNQGSMRESLRQGRMSLAWGLLLLCLAATAYSSRLKRQLKPPPQPGRTVWANSNIKPTVVNRGWPMVAAGIAAFLMGIAVAQAEPPRARGQPFQLTYVRPPRPSKERLGVRIPATRGFPNLSREPSPPAQEREASPWKGEGIGRQGPAGPDDARVLWRKLGEGLSLKRGRLV